MFHVYSMPTEETLYSGYSVRISAEGQSEENVPVQLVRCSAVPYNRRWPGHQRTPDQAEDCGMIRFWMEGAVTLTVTADRDFDKAEIRPSSKGVQLSRAGHTLTFTITQPGGYSLELDGYHNNLHIFADDKPEYQLSRERDVLTYGPGYHEVGVVQLHSHQTVVLQEGAIVYGCFHAKNCEDIAIIGRGIIDGAHNHERILFEMKELGYGDFDVHNAERDHTIHFIGCKGITLDGFTIRDSLCYNVGLWDCDDIEISKLRIVGSWRYNTDGIDFHNCRRGHLTDCFIRTFDDTICYKGHPGYRPFCEDILAENCTVWCDWDHCLEFGAECCAEKMQRLYFRNIDMIHFVDIGLNVGNVDYGTVSDVCYEDIRVEMDVPCDRPLFQRNDETPYIREQGDDYLPTLMSCFIIEHPEYSEGRQERGHIRNITFRNIAVTGKAMPSSRMFGFDEDHKVEHIRMENITFNGQKLKNAEELKLEIVKFAEDITIC